jgi:hypothetical protein
MRARATLVGAEYEFWLYFEAALEGCNCYLLTMDVSWSEQASSNSDYYCKTSGSWFDLWTQEFMAAGPPRAGDGSSQRYQQFCQDALNAERQLDSVAAIQQAIIAAMKRGATFGTAHKEGGTNIYWKGDRFIRSDYGDYPDKQLFTDEADFLAKLRKFLHWDVTSNAGRNQLSELDTWRLILRRMDNPS